MIMRDLEEHGPVSAPNGPHRGRSHADALRAPGAVPAGPAGAGSSASGRSDPGQARSPRRQSAQQVHEEGEETRLLRVSVLIAGNVLVLILATVITVKLPVL
jgi:hypothetical protein